MNIEIANTLKVLHLNRQMSYIKNHLKRCRQIGDNCCVYNVLNKHATSRDRQHD